ncbi:MAG: LLM class flavin-dependent oxidoreductase [Rhodopila sp.]
MKFSNFLFPDSMSATEDGRIIDETLQEARLTDALGFDTIWLAEHHFDGIVAYVDPVAFAAALAVATTRARIGFAVAQLALHHPIRLAEQVALIDHLSKGRLIVGLGRGTAYNIYDYQGFGIDHIEAQARFEEAEAIMFEAWKGLAFEHHGRFFDLCLPELRPAVFTKPHPYVIRAAATEHGMLDIARRGNPFMMNVQSNAVTAQRVALYRQTLREIGLDAATIAARVDECWVWRNVCVAETDAEAERVAIPAFIAMHEHRIAMRKRIYAEQGASILPMPAEGTALPAHASVEHALVCGSPATVAEKLAPLKATGVGGLIMQFRLGPMSHEQAASSLTLFNDKVIPAL